MAGLQPVHLEVLRKSVPYLIENIYDVYEILDNLLAEGVISWDEKDEIESQTTRRRRLDTLLNVLRFKDQHAFEIFCTTLSQCGYAFVREELDRIRNLHVAEGNLSQSKIVHPTDEVGLYETDWFMELTEECRNRQLTQQEVSLLSQHLSPHCFFHVGLLMDFSKSQLEHYQASNPHSTSIQFFMMLSDWLSKEDNRATADRLVLILRSANVDDSNYKDIIMHHPSNSSRQPHHLGKVFSRSGASESSAAHVPQWV